MKGTRPFMEEFRRDRDLEGLSIHVSENSSVLLEIYQVTAGSWRGNASLLEDKEGDLAQKFEVYFYTGSTREGCIGALQAWLYGSGAKYLPSGQSALARVAREDWVC